MAFVAVKILILISITCTFVNLQSLDYCQLSNPCKNRGMCYTVGTQRRCLCVNGWTGDRCRNPPGDVEVTNTDMRPELLELVQDIVTSEIIASADIKDSAKQIRDELNTQWPCCWDVIVVDANVELGYAIWYVPDNHLDVTIRANAGYSRRILVSKDNYDYMTIFYNRDSDNLRAIQSNPVG